MPLSSSVPNVGSQDPELQNSPVAEPFEEEFEVIRQEVEGAQYCYFNGVSYQSGSYVRSGTELLVCDKGLWVNQGNSDPDNP